MKEILLLGKGKSNNALSVFLDKYGIKYDYKELEEVIDFDYKLVIKGPGIYYQNKVVKKFVELNTLVITDIEFIYWFLNRYYIGITGTNGKTTTTMMITNIINQESCAVACGNCGFPISQAAIDYKLFKYFVVELSSFQLKGICKFAPKIAVITNINKAHLDYHETIYDYYNSKYKITLNQSKDDFIILNLDDEKCCEIFSNSAAMKIKYSLKDKSADCYIRHNWFYFKNRRVCKINCLKNITDIMLSNALAAISVCKILKIKNKNIAKGIKSFNEIKYRLQKVKKNIYNDAKSTNIYSTISALCEFKNKDVYLICGGYDRGEDLTPLKEFVGNIHCVYSYGMTGEKIYNFFINLGIRVYYFKTLKEATLKALNDYSNGVILYSPMFASYDQYNSYEERGYEFNKIVNEI